MKKFHVSYMADSAAMAKMMKEATPEQGKKSMDAWMRWMEAHKKATVDMGAPLGKSKRVDGKGAKDAANDLCGYSVVQANSHDEAAKLFDNTHPHLQMPGAWIEITEVMPMPGG